MTKVTQIMRFEIAFDKGLYNLLSDIQYAVWRIKNKAISMAYDWQHFSFSFNERFGSYPKEKEVIGAGISSDINKNVVEFSKNIGSSITDSSIREALTKFKNDKNKIVRGEISIPNYKRGGSFPIRAQSMKELTRINTSKYTIKLSLLSKEGAMERNTTTQQQVSLKTGRGANVILDRIIDGTYKMCDSNISKIKTKYYLMLTYSFEAESKPTLLKSNVCGLDLGVINAATIAFNNDRARYFIGGSEIQSFRARIEARRNALLRQGKYCGEGRKGHGRATRLKPIEKLQGKVANFKDTTNHRYARYIVDMAVKHNCGVIQMEDLSEITKDAERFLKSWTYYDLQTKITQKAKAVGIEVRKVAPRYTSQRCSCCGHIAKENRKSQAEFKCVACGYKTNADYNAAVNIATPNIDSIISQELAKQSAAK